MLKVNRATSSVSGSEPPSPDPSSSGNAPSSSTTSLASLRQQQRRDEAGQEGRRVTKVAIVGSGLSGLAAAHLLALASASPLDEEHDIGVAGDGAGPSTSSSGAIQHGSRANKLEKLGLLNKGAKTNTADRPANRRRKLEVHIFEKAPTLGLDSNSISVKEPGGKTSMRVDVPMRSFNAGYYPEVLSLYKTLGIKSRKSDFTYSFATLNHTALGSSAIRRSGAPSPSLIYNGHSGSRGFGIPSTLAALSPKPSTLRSPSKTLAYIRDDLGPAVWSLRDHLGLLLLLALSYFHLLFLSLWHHILGHTRNPSHPLAQRKLSEWCASKRLNPIFVENIVVPLFSAVMTSQADSVREAPVAEVLEYVACTFLRSHYTVSAGVHQVQKALCKPLDKANVHTGAQVVEISDSSPEEGTISLLVRGADGDLSLFDGFHHCVFATQANQSADFISKYLDRSTSTTESSTIRSKDSDLHTQKLRHLVKALENFRYEHSSVINHTDKTMMPPSKKDWRDLNLVSPVAEAIGLTQRKVKRSESKDGREDEADDSIALAERPHTRTLSSGQTQTMATHIIAQDFPSSNGLQMLMQTTNALPGMTPRPETVLSISNFHRAILTMKGKDAQKGLFEWTKSPKARQSQPRLEVADALPKRSLVRRTFRRFDPLGTRWTLQLGELQGGKQRKLSAEEIQAQTGELGPQIWVCGSWSPGIPLLEGCVRSARLVCEEILRQEGF